MLPADKIHHHPANYNHKYSRQYDQARIGKELKFCNIVPFVRTKWRIDIYENQCKKRCKQYQSDNVPLFIKIGGQWFLKINHQIVLLSSDMLLLPENAFKRFSLNFIIENPVPKLTITSLIFKFSPIDYSSGPFICQAHPAAFSLYNKRVGSQFYGIYKKV